MRASGLARLFMVPAFMAFTVWTHYEVKFGIGHRAGVVPKLGSAVVVGKPSPDFSLQDLDGADVSLSDYHGEHIVLLDFWATWCAPCQAAMPDLVSVHEEFADRNVRVLSVNLGEDRKRVAAFMKRREYDLHVLLDHDGAVGDAYGVRGIPTIVIVDKQGVVRRIYVGGTSKSSLDKYLTELAGE